MLPNEHPRITNVPYRIALVSDLPHSTDEQAGRLLSGYGGKLLERLLNASGILRNACFVGNVSQEGSFSNQILAWDSPDVEAGLAQLKLDITAYEPNLVVLLGKDALRAAGRTDVSLDALRGTFFVCQDLVSPFYGRKCMATSHPSECLKLYDQVPILMFDLQRAKREGLRPEWNPPQRVIKTGLAFEPLCSELRRIRDTVFRLGFDIEGYGTTGISCLSFAERPDLAISVPFSGHLEGSYWSIEEETTIWSIISEILGDTRKTIIIQNLAYEVFVCFWRHHILIRGVWEDTMIAGWEVACELPKGLGFLCSIYTYEPYYKDDRTSEDRQAFWEYNGKDSMVLPEILDSQLSQLRLPERLSHYRFNMSIMPAVMYMQLRGTLFDRSGPDGALKLAADLDAEAEAEGKLLLAQYPNFPVTAKGEIGVNSYKKLAEFLYDFLGLPTQRKRSKGGQPGAITTDKVTLYKLNVKVNNAALKRVVNIRRIKHMASDCASLDTNDDGRVRCGLNPVGTDSGRFSSAESPAGSGRNLQNITKKIRRFFRADPGFWYAQMDLGGSDGWTVAARCHALGDPSMWDDYEFGLKPAKILMLLLRHGSIINSKSRSEIKDLCKSLDVDGADYDQYFSCKRVQHGTNYKMAENTLGETILKDSDGAIWLPPVEATRFQRMYLSRYTGIPKWWSWVAQRLTRENGIQHASGHFRRFFGRPNDDETLRSALAEEPQGNTTYATKLALYKLWYDPLNRRSDGSLTIEPLHTVHDSLNVQFRKADLQFAQDRIPHYFNNPITIGEKTFSIPYDGNYGPSWGECKEKL